MWRSEIRSLSEMEKVWIRRFNNRWSAEYLGSIQIREFETDHAHTIRNTMSANKPVRLSSSELINDDDGAMVDVVLYQTDDGDFGELEFNRLDTMPLIMISKLKA